MRDFDQERANRFVSPASDRSFVLGGHTFVARAGGVRPEETFDFIDVLNGRSELSEADALKLYDETVLKLLEPGHEDAWAAARADSDQPVLAGDIVDVVLFLMGAASGRPPQPSGPSSNGRAATTGTTPSTPASLSPAAPSPSA